MTLPRPDRQALSRDPYAAFGDWLDRVEGVLRAQGRILLLCLDEFEALEEALQEGRLDGRILSTMRHIIQHRERIAVLLSGSHQLDELSPPWAGALITSPVEGFPPIYTPAAVESILCFTHG